MPKFKVGDKVRVINASSSEHENGDIGEIVSLTPFYGNLMHDVDVDGVTQGHYESDLELISSKPTKKQRIKTLEKRIAELESKVATLEKAQTTPKVVPVTSDNIEAGDKVRFPRAGIIEAGDDLTSGKLYEVIRRDNGSGFYVTDDVDADLYIATYEFKYVEKVVSANEAD